MPNAGLDPYDCDCDWLQNAADDPNIPIGFDRDTNEYYIEMRGLGEFQGRAIIRFCPNCGGDASVSKRGGLFQPVATHDQICIRQFADELKTKADVLAKWGKPDEEIRNGYGMPERDKGDQPWRTVLMDLWRYNQIVPTAVVEVIVRPDDRVTISYSPRANVIHEG
jgi:hypothetical protein